jgi:tetratricopeptide (TPR) repeat protein
MKRNVTFALLLIIAVFTLVSCAPSYKSLGKGFDSLTADNPDEAIDNFNYVIDSLPSSSKKKSLAYEGRGWAYYLKGMNDKAEADFLKAGDSIEAKTGLSLVYLSMEKLNDSINTGIFILDEQNEIIVDYLPDPLTRQEFIKTLALSSLLIDSIHYSDIINEINDANFIDRIEAMKDGE